MIEYRDVQQGEIVKLLNVDRWGTHTVRNADGTTMRWTVEEFDLIFEKVSV